MASDPLVSVDELGKRFRIYDAPWHRAVEWASLGRLRRHTDFWALRDVSFRLERGECFGIIGRNGSGKTTLLKILSQVLEPSEGRFRVTAGQVCSLLELGTGFHLDLTGRENVRENAALLGLPADAVGPQLLAEIEDFAELGEFFDQPLRQYSTGMVVRLGFALFASLRPALFILDEALSVGDVFFQQKCAARIDAMRRQGVSFLFVSHDTESVRRLCRETLVLDRGRAVFLGPSAEAINRYHSLMSRDDDRPLSPRPAPKQAEPEEGMTAAEVLRGSVLGGARRHGARALEIVAARITDPGGSETLEVALGKPLHFDLLVAAREPAHSPAAGIVLFDRNRNAVFSCGTSVRDHALPALQPGEAVVVRLRLRFDVRPGPYTFTLGVSDRGQVQDWHEGLGPIQVGFEGPGPLPFYGIARLPLECRHGDVEPT